MSFFGLGPQEILILLLIAILLFGSKKIPELARSLGQAMREFRKASSGLLEEEGEKAVKESKKEEGLEKLIGELADKLGVEKEGKDSAQLAQEVIEKAKEKGLYQEAIKRLEGKEKA